MAEMSRESLLEIVRTVWEERDPVPDGLVERMQEAAAAEEEAAGLAFELELMTLVERSEELAGARGSTAYTLRFAYDDVDLLLRIAADGDRSRVDGWIVPPEPMTVRAIREQTPSAAAIVSDTGRFELTDLPLGLVHLRLEPHDGSRAPFATPTFEI
ncbi:hypothetical protein [Nocardioides sp. KR10-350]|uniref:hypothetical protein n=1 Tax=Nocardioides cheoyonin TaxID=3156615 RepID=UPI0032B564CD